MLDGEHAGRRLWHDVWLTEAAMSLAKRDLGKLGVTSLEQLERPLPEGIIIDAKVALRRGDDGEEFNRVITVRCRRHRARRARAVRTRRRAGRRLDDRCGRIRLATGTTRKGEPTAMTARPYGFRVVGLGPGEGGSSTGEPPSPPMLLATTKRELDREAYLTHFIFGADFADTWSGTARKGYSGPCGADWLFWDIDRPDDLALALSDARRLAGAILDRYRELDDDDLLIFLSGGKGVHVGIPTAYGVPSPALASTKPPSSSAWLMASGPASRSMGRSTRRPGSSGPRTPGTRRRGSSSAGSRSTS